MKKILLILLFVPLVSFGQNGFNYQGIISNSDGTVVASQSISVRFSVIYDSPNGTVAYSELHSPTTGANGLINLKVGTGTQLSSGAFSSVDWSTSYIYLKSEIDITGSGTYVDVGTDLIGQVPVALFAKQLEGITITSGTISATGANLSGTVTASAFVGDGSRLTNVVASSSPTPTFLYGTENVLLDGTTSPNVGTMQRSVGLGYLTLNSVTSGNKNVAIGARVMEENTTGFMNVGIGWNALNKNTVGRSNVAIGGSEALDANTTGNYNVAIGDRAMTYNTTGDSNIAIGYLSLGNNDAGNYNTMIGYGTGSNIRTESGNTGNDNVGMGYRALEKNYSGDKNVGIGFDALRETKGSGNLGIGTNAGKTITSGSNNTLIGYNADVASNALTNATAIGYNASVNASNKIQLGNSAVTLVETSGTVSATDLVVNGSYFSTLTSSVSSLESAYANSVSTGDLIATNDALSSIEQDVDGLLLVINASDNRYNTSVGSTTNYFLDDSSSYNTALGYGALTVSTADENTAIGAFALQANTSGDSNTGLGVGALYTNTTGGSNVALGTGALFSNDSGNGNNAMGYDALRNTSTGDNNVALGYQTGYTLTTGSNNTLIGYDADVASNAITNATAIGANAVVDASNKIRLGDNSITVIEGKVGFTSSSDRRLKANIENTKYGLETILKLAPVDYTLKSNGLAQIGFIAQDLKPIVPEAVNGTEGDIEKGETLGITYSSLIPVLTKAIQEQQQQLEAQQKLIQSLLERLETLENK